MLHENKSSRLFLRKPQTRQLNLVTRIWFIKAIATHRAVIDNRRVHAIAQVIKIALEGGSRDLQARHKVFNRYTSPTLDHVLNTMQALHITHGNSLMKIYSMRPY